MLLEAKLNEQLRILVELQEIDSSILSISDKIESIPAKLEQYKSPLVEARAYFQKFKSKLDDLNKKKKGKDMELEEIQEKIEKLRSRSKEVKTNKEYESHLKEIDVFERNRYRMEDEVLSLMEKIEILAGEIQKEEVKITKAEAEFNQQEKVMEDEKKKLAAEMEAQKNKRKDIVERVDKDIYNRYLTLLKRSGGLAVVPAKDEVCLGCHYNIPPQLFNDIRKNDNLCSCFYCKRFLYFEEPPASDNKSQESASIT